MAEELQFPRECFLCKRRFQFGRGVYEGRNIRDWSIIVCNICYDGNWDGIVPNSYPHLSEHLAQHEIEVRRNEKGWIPWPNALELN